MNKSPLLRLDRILSNLGYATRSTARDLLGSGRVTINGQPATNGSAKARAEDVLLDGEPLDHSGGFFIMLHKPAGFVCSHEAGEGDLIYDLFPDRWRRRTPVPTSIGRLDKDTTGIVLVTDIMPLVHQLASPKKAVEKLYHVSLDPAEPALDEGLVERFLAGKLRLDPKDEKPCLPARLVITGSHTAELTLCEGRFHQVKRMFAACGHTVIALHRSRFGQYSLEDLPEGQWRDCALPVD
jgi:16S rRNA pseudouridine516 synthase